MLGKQWLNRYLRHAGGSTVERSRDRQRKFDGLEKWSFHLFIESLPVMLQIALLLLSCGLSRYMWSVNTSVAHVVVSFTALGILFYIGIVVAGTSSYECPFQTPVPTALRHLRDGRVGHWINQAFRNLKHILVQRLPRLRGPGPLPTTLEVIHLQPPPSRGGLSLQQRKLKFNLGRNADDARCVLWILQNLTDPEAIDSAIRLAGIIRWFISNSSPSMPLYSTLPVFAACFDSTKQLYPGMRDRAYFSAQAILRTNIGPGALSLQDDLEDYTPASSFQHTDPDFHHILSLLQCNLNPQNPTLDFPRGNTHTLTHLLWVSNLFVDLAYRKPDITLKYCQSYPSVAATNHHAVIANTLLMWYILLGGHIEEETLWATDKLWVLVLLSLLSFIPPKIIYASHPALLQVIISHLSTRVMNAIVNGNYLQHLYYLLEFLAAWEKRPTYLTLVAYRWCSTISETAGRLGQSGTPIIQPQHLSRLKPELQAPQVQSQFQPTSSQQDLIPSEGLENPPFASHYIQSGLTPLNYAHLLSRSLEIGFRLTTLSHDQPHLKLNHTSHHGWVFETAFSSHDDDFIADAVCVWIAAGNHTPPGSYVCYFTKRVERDTPFSPRLRQASICAIEHTWRRELEVSVVGTVNLLNRLNVDVGDVDKSKLAELLTDVICSPTGLESLSPHYWHLVDKMALAEGLGMDFTSCSAVMILLEEAEDWEKLELWMAIIWRSVLSSRSVEEIEQVTLKLLSRRPSALQRFEVLCETESLSTMCKARLGRVCDQARAEHPPSEFPPPYVSVRSDQHLVPVLISSFFRCSQTQPPVPLPFAGDGTF